MSNQHFINECPVCHAISQCRCMGPKTKTFNPCPGCKDKDPKEAAKRMFEELNARVADFKGPITAGGAMPEKKGKADGNP